MSQQSITQRIFSDLKVSYFKTVFMLVLGVVFVFVWKPIIFSKGAQEAVTANLKEALTDWTSGDNLKRVAYENQNLDRNLMYPLSKPIPFKDLKHNPFKMIAQPRTDAENLNSIDEEKKKISEEEELKKIQAIKAFCTLTGEGTSYVVLDGKIFKENDTYNDFTIKEIGEGFVVLRGETITKRVEVNY